jgi:hypothetical protein
MARGDVTSVYPPLSFEALTPGSISRCKETFTDACHSAPNQHKRHSTHVLSFAITMANTTIRIAPLLPNLSPPK